MINIFFCVFKQVVLSPLSFLLPSGGFSPLLYCRPLIQLISFWFCLFPSFSEISISIIIVSLLLLLLYHPIAMRVKKYRFYTSCSQFSLLGIIIFYIYVFLKTNTKTPHCMNFFSWPWYSTEGFYPPGSQCLITDHCFPTQAKVTQSLYLCLQKFQQINVLKFRFKTLSLKGMFWTGQLLNVSHGLGVKSLLKTNIKLLTAGSCPFIFRNSFLVSIM